MHVADPVFIAKGNGLVIHALCQTFDVRAYTWSGQALAQVETVPYFVEDIRTQTLWVHHTTNASRAACRDSYSERYCLGYNPVRRPSDLRVQQ